MITPNHFFPALLILLSIGTSGCTGLVVGGAAAVGTTAMQERGLKTAISDTTIDVKINNAYLEHDVDFRFVSIDVHEGRVLLTGTVPKPDDRIEAVRLAWQVEGVKEVINEMAIKDSGELLDFARDKWVTTQLRLKITLDTKIQSINYSIDTVNGTVYLLGIAQDHNELRLVKNHARGLEYVRRIVSHVRVKTATAQGAG